MRISVVTPNYNGALTVERTINSVLNQRYHDMEHIIVDDGSTDHSRSIIRRFGSSVRLIEKANGGQPSAVNVGLREATGELVCWLNSDDLLLPGAAEKAATAFRSHPEASIVYGDYFVIDEEDRVGAARKQPTFDYNTCLYGYLTVSNAAAFFSRSAIREAGGRCDPAYPRACDVELIVKVAKHGPVIHIPEFLGAYRHRQASIHISQADLLDEETWSVRECFSGLDRMQLHVLHRRYKAKAAVRILAEGALWCRLWPFSHMYFRKGQSAVRRAITATV